MYNPTGYTTVFELEKKALDLQIMGLRPSDFLRNLLKVPTVSAVDSNGKTFEISKDIFAKCDEQFAFLDSAWKINFDLIREAPGEFEMGEERLYQGMTMLVDDFSEYVTATLPDSLLKFEGSLLFLRKEDAETVLGDLEGERDLIARGAATNHETMDDVREAYKKFVKTQPDANVSTREQWRKMNHLNGKKITRQTERNLRDEFAPDSWSDAGVRSKKPTAR